MRALGSTSRKRTGRLELRLPGGLSLGLALLASLVASCAGRNSWPNFSTQQYPEPMESSVDPLPPGVEANYPPGTEEVIVRRLADPVQLKPAGQHAAFQLRYFDKRRRVNSGAWVFCSPGGRAEVLWPGTGSTAVLFDRCTAIVGSPSRGEPNLMLREIERVVLNLNPGDQVELLGGGLLTADSGPWILERRLFDILRVKNQTKVPGEVAYRDEVFVLGPGETVDLPLLSAGGAPIPEVPGTREVAGPGFGLKVFGEVEVEEAPGALRLRASGEHEIQGLGVRLHLDQGETARLGAFTRTEDLPVTEEPAATEEPSATEDPAPTGSSNEEPPAPDTNDLE